MSAPLVLSRGSVVIDVPPESDGSTVVKVFVLGDGDIARHGLCSRLNAAAGVEVVGDHRSGDSAASAASRLGAELIVIQARLSDRAAIGCVRGMQVALPAVPVLLAARARPDETVLTAIMCGARGYVPERAEPTALSVAAHRLHSGANLLVPDELSRVLSPLLAEGVAPALQRSERALLKLLGRGLTNGQIAYCMEIRPSAVAQQIDALIAKLGGTFGLAAPNRSITFGDALPGWRADPGGRDALW